MRKRLGFTLVELLVVIAIIALLMSILMPALARVRKQAKNTLCKATLKQWGSIFTMYTNDNGGYFHGELGANYMHQGWVPALRPYYSGIRRHLDDKTDEGEAERGIRLCPSAKAKFRSDGFWGPDVAWGIYSGGADDEGAWWAWKGDCGSYGLNGWVCNEESGVSDWWDQAGSLWRTPNVRNALHVPVFADCGWVDGWPEYKDSPPEFNGEMAQSDMYWSQAMKQFCIGRHDNKVNYLFMDWSVGQVDLKELWTLKWHRAFDTQGPWTKKGGCGPEEWPEWMRSLKTY